MVLTFLFSLSLCLSSPSAGKSLSDDQTTGPILSLPPPAARLPPPKAHSQDCSTQCDYPAPTPETVAPTTATASETHAAATHGEGLGQMQPVSVHTPALSMSTQCCQCQSAHSHTQVVCLLARLPSALSITTGTGNHYTV